MNDDYVMRESDLLSDAAKELFGFGRKSVGRDFSRENLSRDVDDSPVIEHSIPVPRKRDRSLLNQHTDYRPDLHDVVDYYCSRNVVGEQDVCVLQTLGAINKLCFGIDSLSGSGKSFLVNALIDLLPDGSVYSMELSSKTAEFYQAEQINQCDIIYIPELQKAMSSKLVVEILKNLTEGKSAVRTVRDQSVRQNMKYVISADKGVVFTLATENPFKYDREFARRVFVLHTDVSPEQTDRILKHKARSRHKSLETDVELSFDALRAHIARCLDQEFSYENPFADYISEQIPRNIRARSYDDHLFNLINASTKFHYPSRMFGDGLLFVSIGDVYHIYNAYWEQFIHGLLGVPALGTEVMNVFEDGKLKDSQAVYKDLRQNKVYYPFDIVEQTLDALVDSGFLDKDDYKARDPKYKVVRDIPSFNSFDWQACWESGVGFLDKYHPKLLNPWVSSQSDDLVMIEEIKIGDDNPWKIEIT